MSIDNTEIEDTYECITKMKGVHDYFKRWQNVRNIWAKRFDKGTTAQEEHYTPHNHVNHNIGIYYILSNILIPSSAYNKKMLNQENLFILNLAVLFHDIMMTFSPEKRFEHSVAASKFLLTQMGDNFGITDNELYAIAQVALAHTDLKDENGKVKVNLIDQLIKDTTPLPTGKMGKINIKILAGLLRLADEFDIHSERIDGFEYKNRTMKASSIDHWRICEIMSYPEINNEDVSDIQLVPKQQLIMMQNNIDNDLQLIKKLENKISSELEYARKHIFSKGELNGWSFHSLSVRLDGELKEKYDELKNPFQTGNSFPVIIESKKIENDKSVAPDALVASGEKFKIIPLNEELDRNLSDLVINGRLLKSGHFKINENLSVRDWINSRILLENQEILDKICNEFYPHVQDNSYLIGIDQYGLMIAALLGVKTNNPFTYVISEKLDKLHIEKEKEIEKLLGKKVIFITDVIVTLNTINKIIDSLKEKFSLSNENIDKIFTVFIRDQIIQPNKKYDIIEDKTEKFVNKIFVLNRSFPVEICSKEDCIFIKNNINMYTDEPQELS